MAKKNQVVSINNTIATADTLAEQHVAYTEQYVTRANTELYKILSGIMALSVEIQSSNLREKIIKQMRETLRDKYIVKTQANSKLSSIVVKYVIRTGRKTAHVYGRVIQTAIDAGITADQLPAYITENGGVDAIRKKGVDAEAQKQAKQFNDAASDALAYELAENHNLATLQSTNGKRISYSGADDVRFTYLMCVNGPLGGELKVVAALYPSSKIEQEALALFHIICNAVAYLDDGIKFEQFCTEHGLNMRMVQRFMRDNDITNAAMARELLLTVRNTMKIDGELLPKAQHKKAA